MDELSRDDIIELLWITKGLCVELRGTERKHTWVSNNTLIDFERSIDKMLEKLNGPKGYLSLENIN